ncbi:MAG: molecular chaperone HtpG [Deltaproteobacteria bacterium RIFOXYA12_FULL_58_15]|nr:MAG: molecular chaperone HtpG [Deltaproteobacteria bacterium RIFOXYA12_FULL_58_15]OGR12487.1 MAG: molecular chaperone HtpG [Deltaproteobacteria bacterium RIFOXYB12_FULL_58_9]
MPSKGSTHTFKAETRELLDLMIHSLYSNKAIFLRELISNASDALDRLRFESLTNHELLRGDERFEIRLESDPETRTLTIHDSGIGMSEEEVIENIGTIAHSGTKELLRQWRDTGSKDLPPAFIGQFGVGFYSTFMVADIVVLVTKRAGQDVAVQWKSSGDGSYELSHVEREQRGTSITLHLKAEDAEDGLEDFTSEFVLSRIVKQYSDFVTYPIQMRVYREQEAEGTGKKSAEAPPAVVVEDRTLNSMQAIWSRPQSEVKDEEYKEFYRHISHDWNDYLTVITQHAEGSLEYQALLFIPSQPPNDLFYQAFESGLQLYSKKVRIIEQCSDLLPRYLRFVRGVVECPDLPLNVSREMLQTTREIGLIRKALAKKVLGFLDQLKADKYDDFLKFWKGFGRALKEGVHSDFDNRDRLTKLLLFQSSNHPSNLTSLEDYVARMKPEQSEIYFVTGQSRALVENLPSLETFSAKGYEVLYWLEPVDELLAQHLFEFGGKRLKSIGKGTIDLGDEEEKKQAKTEREAKAEVYGELLAAMQKKLDAHVKEVRLSSRLTKSVACLVGADHDYSPQLEKLLLKGKGGGPAQRRILELNSNHALLDALHQVFMKDADSPMIGEFAELLLGQALLAEGSDIPDPSTFARQVVELMLRATRTS